MLLSSVGSPPEGTLPVGTSARKESRRLQHLAKVFLKLRRFDAAVYHASEAVDVSRAPGGSPVDVARALAHLGEAHAQAGHHASARAVLEDARHTAAEIPEGSERDDTLAIIAAATSLSH